VDVPPKVVNLRDQISQTKLATDMIILFFDIGAPCTAGPLAGGR